MTARRKWNERTRCFSRVNDAWIWKCGSEIGSLSCHTWIARASTFRHLSSGRESRFDYPHFTFHSCARRDSRLMQIETVMFQFEESQLYGVWKTARSLVNGLTAIHVPERRDEKSRPAQFTCDTTVNRFQSRIFSFTHPSRVRNSVFARFISSLCESVES